MLIEQLFANGTMVMGPSRVDPRRQVGTFPADFLKNTSVERMRQLESFRWIEGEWDYENEVPPTRLSPGYTDVGTSRFAFDESRSWVCATGKDGRQHPYITYDPPSKQWIYVLTRGSYGILRSVEGWRHDQIVFQGLMTMLGINCEWRMTWTRLSGGAFSFVNAEWTVDGAWSHIDEWRFSRKV